jgi:hypothetical protein
MTFIFPFLLICLDIGAAIVYAIYGDYRHTVYWIAAATLTACVTF